MSSDPLQRTDTDLDYMLTVLHQILEHLNNKGKGSEILEDEGIESIRSAGIESIHSALDVNVDNAGPQHGWSGNADVERFQKENEELSDKLLLANATITAHKEDFGKEREDRTRSIEKIGQLEARVTELQCELDAADTKRKTKVKDKNSREQLDRVTAELDRVTAELEAAKEEIAVKVAQVKQYQKQVEACKQEAQLRNEFEQLYNEEKQKNVRLMEEIDQLNFKKNEFEQLYNKEKEINVRLTEERQNINHLQKMASSTRGEDGIISGSSQTAQNLPEPSASKEPTLTHVSHDNNDDLPPPLKRPKANHPPNTVSHLPQSRPIAYPVEASQHHNAEASQIISLVNIPFDPNLKCPICRRMFRKGEIQLYKQHVEMCQNS